MITNDNVSTITDLRFKTKDILEKTLDGPVFLFQHSRPKGVILSYDAFQEMTSKLEDYFTSFKAEEYEKEDKKNITWLSHEKIKNILKP